ncbi:MAG: class I SAM-dependent methyltransferase, partial [Candidatus Omnitrophica bacterium]|nr:class I SAM-dependent methyltransferase [Candidatus Omnitrophota bacterium]
SLRYPNEQIIRFIARRKSRAEGNHLVFHIGKEVSVTMASESNVLEIDFQSLANIMMLKDHGYNAFGVSVNKNLIFRIREELKQQGLPKNVNIDFWDGCSLPFSRDYFDIVISKEAAYCQPDQKLFIKECFRIIKPNGEVFFFYLSPRHGYVKYAKSIGNDLYQFSAEHPEPRLRNMIVFLPDKKTLESLWSPFFEVKVGMWEYDFDSVFSSFFVVYGKKVLDKEKS